MTNTHEILLAAAALIERPGAWCQGAYAKNASGEFVEEFHKDACSWCAVGAITKAALDAGKKWQDVLTVFDDFIAQYAGVLSAAVWNDAPARTQSEVVEALRQAANLAKSIEPTNEE